MASPLRILHLEDNPADADLIRAALETDGIVADVDRVETQAEFVAALERRGADIILADHTLPSFDGMSALQIARDRCPDVPFIFVPGTLVEDVAIEALKVGATDYLLKDRLSKIVPSVHRALREARDRAERVRAEAFLAGENRLLEMIARGTALADPRHPVPPRRGPVARRAGFDPVARPGRRSTPARRGAESTEGLRRRDRRRVDRPRGRIMRNGRVSQRTGDGLRHRSGSPVGRLSGFGPPPSAPRVLVDPRSLVRRTRPGHLRDLLPRTAEPYAGAAANDRADHRPGEHRDRAQAVRGGAAGAPLVSRAHGSGEPGNPGNERPRTDDERRARGRAVDLRLRSILGGLSMRSQHLVLAVRGQDEEPGVLQLPREIREQQRRALVGPVQVVEHDDQRIALRRAAQERGDAVEEPQPGLLGVAPRRLGIRAGRRWLDGTSGAMSAASTVTSACARVDAEQRSKNRRTTCIHGQYAGSPSCSGQRPHSTPASGRDVQARNSSSSRVFPMPGSPTIATSWPVPAVALSRAPASSPISTSRPMNVRRAPSLREAAMPPRSGRTSTEPAAARRSPGTGVEHPCCPENRQARPG